METSVDKLLVTVRGSSGAVKIIADNEPDKALRTFTKTTHTLLRCHWSGELHENSTPSAPGSL